MLKFMWLYIKQHALLTMPLPGFPTGLYRYRSNLWNALDDSNSLRSSEREKLLSSRREYNVPWIATRRIRIIACVPYQGTERRKSLPKGYKNKLKRDFPVLPVCSEKLPTLDGSQPVQFTTNDWSVTLETYSVTVCFWVGWVECGGDWSFGLCSI